MGYLTVDDQANFVDVQCDGYVLRVSKLNTINIIEVRDTAAIILMPQRVLIGGTVYSIGQDTSRSTVITESHATRVVITITGNIKDTGGNPPTNSISAVTTVVVYPDSVHLRYCWEIGPGSITTDSSTLSYIWRHDNVNTPLPQETYKYPVAGPNEVADSFGLVSQAAIDYLVFRGTSKVVNTQWAWVYDSTSLGDYYITGNGAASIRWNAFALGPGTEEAVIALVVDSEDREGLTTKYAESDRISIGQSWHNPVV